MNWSKLCIYFLWLWSFAPLQAQNTIDSLEKKLPQATGREEVDIMVALANEYIYKDIKLAFNFSLNALQKAKRINYQKGKMGAYNAYGNCFVYRAEEGDLANAFENYIKNVDSVALGKPELQLEKAKALNGLANIYYQWGDYETALRDNLNALKIREKQQDERGMARSYNLMGNIYDALGDYNNAIKYYTKALNLYEKLKAKRDIAGVLNNLASSIQIQVEIQGENPDYTQAISYYSRALQINLDIKDERGAALVYNNLGIIASVQKNYSKALELFFKALEIDENLNSLEGKAYTLNNIALVFQKKEEPEVALEYYQKAVEAGFNISAKASLQTSFSGMAKAFEMLGQFPEAYQHIQLANYYKDQLAKSEASRRIGMLTSRYEVEKKQKELEAEKRKTMLAELQLEKKSKMIYWVLLAILGISILAVWLYYRNYITSKLNSQLAEQKQEILNKSKSLTDALQKLAENKENLMDSILYARRIQDSILPPKKDLLSGFAEGFVMNKPKAVVSGDFYWCAEKRDVKIVVLSDCTGHGVPGAFMTVMGNTLLNEIVHEQDITDPKEILFYLDKKITTLQAGGSKQVNDGMDIAIAAFNFEAQTVIFAGAKSHLYRVVGEELITYKGSRFSVGSNQYKVGKYFDNQQIKFEKGDVFYMFSDGIQDQFGGKKGRKFMIKRLRELLVSVHTLQMEEQQIQIGKAITIWKENQPQTDDMLMVGLKI